MFTDLTVDRGNGSSSLQRPAKELAKMIQEALTLLDKGQKSAKLPQKPILRVLQQQINELPPENRPSLELACFCVLAYSERNIICHSGIFEKPKETSPSSLVAHIREDRKTLRDILPDNEIENAEKWDDMICYFRNRHLKRNPETGKWEYRSKSETEDDSESSQKSVPANDDVFESSCEPSLEEPDESPFPETIKRVHRQRIDVEQSRPRDLTSSTTARDPVAEQPRVRENLVEREKRKTSRGLPSDRSPKSPRRLQDCPESQVKDESKKSGDEGYDARLREHSTLRWEFFELDPSAATASFESGNATVRMKIEKGKIKH